MAKLVKLPSQAVINGFKGTVDFYVHMGIPCARRWPRSPGRRRAPAVEAQWEAFAYATKSWNTLSPAVQEAYRLSATTSALSGRDFYTSAFVNADFIELPR